MRPLSVGIPQAAPALRLKAKPPFPHPSLPWHPGGELVQTVCKEGVSQRGEKALQFTAQHALTPHFLHMFLTVEETANWETKSAVVAVTETKEQCWKAWQHSGSHAGSGNTLQS